jgi:hypothetical protein
VRPPLVRVAVPSHVLQEAKPLYAHHKQRTHTRAVTNR